MAGRGIKDFGGYPHTSDKLMASKTHLKHMSSVEGDGGVREYPDTDEMIQRNQKENVAKMRAHHVKPGYRH